MNSTPNNEKVLRAKMSVAFRELQKKIPYLPDAVLSRRKVLHLAILYIEYLKKILELTDQFQTTVSTELYRK